MFTVNLHDAKTSLSHLLDLAAKGEKVVVCKRNVPCVELRPVGPRRPKPAIGKCPHKFEVPESFFEPLPDDLLALFNGGQPG